MEEFVRPGSRLVTQNLLVSARFAEVAKNPDWEAVGDLSLLIDTYCLHDEIVVLGRDTESYLRHSDSALTDLLLRTTSAQSDECFVRVEKPKGAETEKIATSAKRRLLSYLGDKEDDSDTFSGLLSSALDPSYVEYGLINLPDRGQEVQVGTEWLKTVPSRTDLLQKLSEEQQYARSTTFLVRSFLYVAYAETAGLVFTPDTTREPILESMVQLDHDLRSNLSSTLNTSWEQMPGMSALQLSVPTTLLAAIVYERAKPDKSQIVPQMKRLREEIEPLRKRIRASEREILRGTGAQPVEALNEWKEVFRELARGFGSEPRLLNLDQLLKFGEQAGDVMDNPHSAKSWASVLLGLPFDIVRRLVYRGPVIEINRVLRERPAAVEFREAIRWIFNL